jgi:hypothetical protein
MTSYVIPDLSEMLLALQRIASSGRIILDNSAATFPVGVRENGRLQNQDLLQTMIYLALDRDDAVFPLLEKQKDYVDELAALANEKKIFTIKDVIDNELSVLKEKSEGHSHLLNFTKEFNESMKDFEQKINNLYCLLKRNIPPEPARPYIFEKISRIINSMSLGKNGPSPVDRKIVATAIYESCASGKQVNVLSVDPHIINLLQGYNKKDRKYIKGNAHCFTFDQDYNYVLVGRK